MFRLINFVLEVEGFMPCIGELQLHLRSIQEIKVGVCSLVLAWGGRRARVSRVTQKYEAHLLYEIDRASTAAELVRSK